jgi:hypothetical protein
MSSWTNNLKIELLSTGTTSWGDLTNNNWQYAIDQGVTGYATPSWPAPGNADYDWGALYTNSNSSQEQRNLFIRVTGTITAARNFIVPTIQKQYIIWNNTTGGYSITVKTSAGSGVTIPNGYKMHVYVNGTDVIQMVDYFISPTFLTPVLGTPASGNLSNCTNIPAAQLTGLGTNIGTFLVTPSSANLAAAVTDETGSGALVFGTSPTLTTPVIAQIVNTGTLTLPTSTDTLVGRTTTDTLTNKNIQSRVVSIADATSITINADTTDIATQTNTQAVGTLTINAPTGTPFNGQKIVLRLQSTNIQTFSWNGIFAGSTDLALPTASSGSSKYDYVGFIYNSTASKWQLLAKVFGF